MKTTQTTTITKTMPKQTPKPQRRRRNVKRNNQVLTKIVNTTANVASGSTIRGGPGAKMVSNGNMTRITNREFISDISSSASGFSATNIAINPGSATAFPWLSAIAANYESYTFKRLSYRYVPLCPTSTPGRVTMAIDFDARDAAPTSKAVLSQYQGAVAVPVWQQGVYTANSANLVKFAKQRYVNGPTPPANSDVKTYHLGNFIIATSNTPTAAAALGELWVEYDVELQTPQIATVAASAQQSERQPISGGAQRVKIGIRNGLPVFDTSFSDEIHNILGETWNYLESGVSKSKFSVLFNKNLNHPVLYLIRYINKIRTVRPLGANTGFFTPSLRQRGDVDTTLLFSSINMTSTFGVGLSDPINAPGFNLKNLFFIAYPKSQANYNDDGDFASQIQFAYDRDGPNAIGNVEAAIDIQTFALPPMQNNDTSNTVFIGTPVENPNGTVHKFVDSVNWLRFTNQLSAYSGGATLRQVTDDYGEIQFKPLTEVLQAEERQKRGTDSNIEINHLIETVIKRIQELPTIEANPE